MLPVSESVYTERHINMSDESVDWILFDVYKIAPNFPLEISELGRISDEKSIADYDVATTYMEVGSRFYNKSSRDDLKGLKIKCGLVVSILKL